jgi:Uma2 family endonuclease
MATTSTCSAPPAKDIPVLRAGDHLTGAEFERRYRALPPHVKAELIEGVVYMPSPVSTEVHGDPHFDLISWLGHYRTFTPGVRGGDNATVRLDADNVPQPDAHLRILPECGGQTRLEGGYLRGAPELMAEIAASSVNYDLHEKLNVYRRNGVQEYVVWRVEDQAVDWFVLHEGRFEPLPLTPDGLYKSLVFPGLWLDPAALLRGDMVRVLQVVDQGLASPEHAEFKKRLAAACSPG